MPRSISVSVDAFQKIPLLDGLALEAVAAIARACTWHRYARGEFVITHLASDRDVYFVCRGRVSVTAVSARGREVKYRDIGPGEWFGDLAALDGLRRAANVVAIQETDIAAMSPTAFRRLLLQHPPASDRMFVRLALSVREMTDRVFALSTLGVENRVHAEVLRLARTAGVVRNRARIEPPPTHEELAHQVSTDRSEVTRALSRMVKAGLLEIERRRAMLVLDVDALAALVDDAWRPD